MDNSELQVTLGFSHSIIMKLGHCCVFKLLNSLYHTYLTMNTDESFLHDLYPLKALRQSMEFGMYKDISVTYIPCALAPCKMLVTLR
jgi:hypothetical protein